MKYTTDKIIEKLQPNNAKNGKRGMTTNFLFYDRQGELVTPVKRKRKRPDLSQREIEEIKRYDKDMRLKWLKENHYKYTTKSIASAMKISPSAVSSKLTNLHLRAPNKTCVKVKREGICCRKKCLYLLSDQELLHYFNLSNAATNEVEKKKIIFELFYKMKSIQNFPCVKWSLSFGISRAYRQNVIDQIISKKDQQDLVNGNKGKKSNRRLDSAVIATFDTFIKNLREKDEQEVVMRKEKVNPYKVSEQPQPTTFVNSTVTSSQVAHPHSGSKDLQAKDQHSKDHQAKDKLKFSTHSFSSKTSQQAQTEERKTTPYTQKFQFTFHNESDQFSGKKQTNGQDDWKQVTFEELPTTTVSQKEQKRKKPETLQTKMKIVNPTETVKELNIPGTSTMDLSKPIYTQQNFTVPQIPVASTMEPFSIEAIDELFERQTSYYGTSISTIRALGALEEEETYLPITALADFDNYMSDEEEDQIESHGINIMKPIMMEDDDLDDESDLDETTQMDAPTISAAPPVSAPPLPPMPELPPPTMLPSMGPPLYPSQMLPSATEAFESFIPSTTGPGVLSATTALSADFDDDDLEDDYDDEQLPQHVVPPVPSLSQMDDDEDYTSSQPERFAPPKPFPALMTSSILPKTLHSLQLEEEDGSFRFPTHIKSIASLYKEYKRNLKPTQEPIKETKFRQLLKNRYHNTRIVKTNDASAA